MRLYEEILLQAIRNSEENILSSAFIPELAEIVESVSYKALCKIKQMIQDESLSDKECFQQIEEVICILEEIGSNGGERHNLI